jgi:hypothetical protein
MTVEVEGLRGQTVVQDDRNYIVRHWVGALSLPQSYWVNGVLIAMPFNLYFRMISLMKFERPIEYLTLGALPFFLYIPIGVWQGVGIWRSAGNCMREGMYGWALVARAVIVLNGIVLAFSLMIAAKSAWSMSVAYIQQSSATYTVKQAGNVVNFSGQITPDSADRLEALLNPKSVNQLTINQSPGGFVRSALRIARLIQNKKLTVVAISDCSSGCTVLLASGARRMILPETIMRLHAGSVIGTGEKLDGVDKESVDEMEKDYLRVGMRQEFLAKVNAHRGRYDLYEPTLEELIQNGLVTDVYDRQVFAFLPAQVWCDANPDQCRRTGRENRAARSKSR